MARPTGNAEHGSPSALRRNKRIAEMWLRPMVALGAPLPADAPLLDDPAVRDAKEMHRPPNEVRPGRRVGSSPGFVCGHEIRFGDDRIERDYDIRIFRSKIAER